MRDALSIMDQAIACAPIEDGRSPPRRRPDPRADGHRPERRLRAHPGRRNANNSAEVITIANELLDAGNSPAQLARQCVRYLRNALIAKIAGLCAEANPPTASATSSCKSPPTSSAAPPAPPPSSAKKSSPASSRSCSAPSTSLGYRQEQRFHFELGLLKLVHLRRLLPIEEALSQLPATKRVPHP